MVCNGKGRKLEEFAVRELLHQFAISVEKVELRQLTPVHPAEITEDAVLHLTFVLFNQEEVQFHSVSVRVVVLHLRDFTADLRADSKLFIKFTLECGWRIFSWFYLSAGKLPLERQCLIFRPLAAKDLFPSHDERGDYLLNQACSTLLHVVFSR